MSEGSKKDRPVTRSTEAAAEQQQLTLATLVIELEKARSDITTALQTALLPIQTTLDAVKRQVESFEARFTDTEGVLSDHSDRITAVETTVEELQATVLGLAKENEELKDTLDGYENRQRRSNLRVLGIPEDSERGQCPLKFMSELLVKALNDSSFTKPPELERCHRAGAKPGAGARPRPFVMCFHRYPEKEQVLQLAIQKRQLSYEGKKILIFPDYSTRLATKRGAYKKVKTRLYERGIKFSLRYPATLVVYFNGTRHSFSTAEAAEAFFNQHLGQDDGAQSSSDH